MGELGLAVGLTVSVGTSNSALSNRVTRSSQYCRISARSASTVCAVDALVDAMAAAVLLFWSASLVLSSVFSSCSSAIVAVIVSTWVTCGRAREKRGVFSSGRVRERECVCVCVCV